MTMVNALHTAQRLLWRGVFAGLVIGTTVLLAMLALALVIGAMLSLDLYGASISAGVYAVISALLSAFAAGFFAVKYLRLKGETAISEKDAKLTGFLTACVMILASSFFALNTAGSVISGAGKVAGSVVSGVGSVVSGTASAIGGAVTTGANAAGAIAEQGNFDLQSKAEKAYKQITNQFNRRDIEELIAKNSQTLDKEQVSAIGNVIEGLLEETKNDFNNIDFTSLNTWRNLDVYAKEMAEEMEELLKGDELVYRLVAEGLTEQEAKEIQQHTLAQYEVYKTRTEQAIKEARAQAEALIAKAQELAEQAEAAARKAAMFAGLFWLISALATLFAALAGARTAVNRQY